MNNIDKEKLQKKERLLNSGFELFMNKGINNTSIQDITDKADVAKGTFYLYYKNKYELQNDIIVLKSKELLDSAIKETQNKNIKNLDDKIISVIDHIINTLKNSPLLMNLIGKDISLGYIEEKFDNFINDDEDSIQTYFMKAYEKSNIKLKNPIVTFYMILPLIFLLFLLLYNCLLIDLLMEEQMLYCLEYNLLFL